jgi:hypothetical protein
MPDTIELAPKIGAIQIGPITQKVSFSRKVPMVLIEIY